MEVKPSGSSFLKWQTFKAGQEDFLQLLNSFCHETFHFFGKQEQTITHTFFPACVKMKLACFSRSVRFDNVTRRYRYSQGPSGFLPVAIEGMSFFIGLF